MTNQERSIFHSNGMPLRLSDHAGAGWASSLWMSPFSIAPEPQVVSHSEGLSDPALDGPVGQDEQAAAFPETLEQSVVFEKGSQPGAYQVTQPIAPSFSWPVEPHRPHFAVAPQSSQRESAAKSTQDSEPAVRIQRGEPSPGSMATDLPDPAQPLLRGVKITPRPTSDDRPSDLAAPAFSSESRTFADLGTNESEARGFSGESAISTGDRVAARRENEGRQQSLGTNAIQSLRLDRVDNNFARMQTVKVTASRRTIDFEKPGSRQLGTSILSWTGNPFFGQKLRAEVSSTIVAPKTEALEVLERLSSVASQAAAAPRSGRQVHIGKLHITVQRPPVEAPPPQLPIAEGRSALQPASHVFLDPWERHYSSFD